MEDQEVTKVEEVKKPKQEYQIKTINIVVNKNGDPNTDTIFNTCLQLLNDTYGFTEYHYIKHDKDKDDNGLIPGHYHLICTLKNRTRTKSVVRLFEKNGIDTTGIEVRPIKSFKGAAQYLIHMNNEEKYQYDPQEVHSFGPTKYDFYIQCVNASELTETTFIEAIKNCSNDSGIINPYKMLEYLGLDNFKKNLNLIRYFEEYNKTIANSSQYNINTPSFEETGEVE